MIVIESGGTKSTWVFKSEIGEIQSVESVGLHPQELSADKEKIIHSLILNNSLGKEDVYFYGAGCESPEAKIKITSFLKAQGLEVKQVQTDIYAACIAHLGNSKGVVGILGTGAVAAQFDGKKVIKQTSGLGYVLGDEGSGFDIGKRLLQKKFRGELSEDLSDAINTYFHNKSILHRIHEPDGRMCIAGLTKIVYDFSSDGLIQKILAEAFSDYCEIALLPLGRESPINFIGSVAYYFQDDLEKATLLAGFKMGEVKKEAVFGAFDFLSNENNH